MACQPNAMPVPMISAACATSITSTFAVLAASNPARDRGVTPSRFKTP